MVARKILVVDDEKGIRDLARRALEKEGFSVVTADDGKKGLEAARAETPDLVVLDFQMPAMDGFEVCRALKRDEATRSIPVLFLSRKGEVPDKVAGLALGADDYLAKPFSIHELVARIRTVLRRFEEPRPLKVTRCGTLEADWERYEVKVAGKPVGLSTKELEVLRALVKANGRVLTRDQILENVWGLERSMEVQTRTVDQHIAQIRRKLGGEGKRIRSVRDAGYSFEQEEEGGEED